MELVEIKEGSRQASRGLIFWNEHIDDVVLRRNHLIIAHKSNPNLAKGGGVFVLADYSISSSVSPSP